MKKNIKDSKQMTVTTININGKSNTKPTDSTADYIKSLCKALTISQSDNRFFPWWVFTLMACVVITLLVVIWVAKSDSSWGLSSLFCSVFYEIDEKSDQDNTAEEVLRLWQMGALEDEEENDLQEPEEEQRNSNRNSDHSDNHSDNSEDDNVFTNEIQQEDNSLLN